MEMGYCTVHWQKVALKKVTRTGLEPVTFSAQRDHLC